MNCYQHSHTPALGLCKHCQKAVCAECAIDTNGAGLACSAACENEVRDMQAIFDKSKIIYRIGRKPSALNSNVLTYLMVGSLFAGYGIYDFVTGS
ncbi:MAG: hypothetical protein R3270_12060, partial [Gammaproteobacteria bacterium]|nr:hypothetical protein [Gammaproteobacteria bacterium]